MRCLFLASLFVVGMAVDDLAVGMAAGIQCLTFLLLVAVRLQGVDMAPGMY